MSMCLPTEKDMNVASAVCDKCYFIKINVYLKSPSLLLVRLWPQATIVLTPQVL